LIRVVPQGLSSYEIDTVLLFVRTAHAGIELGVHGIGSIPQSSSGQSASGALSQAATCTAKKSGFRECAAAGQRPTGCPDRLPPLLTETHRYDRLRRNFSMKSRRASAWQREGEQPEAASTSDQRSATGCRFESGLVFHRKRVPASRFCLAGMFRLRLVHVCTVAQHDVNVSRRQVVERS